MRSRRAPSLRIAAAAALAAAALLGAVSCDRTDEPGDPTPVPTATQQAAPAPDPRAGVFDDRIVFGQSAAFSGPAQALGTNMRLGIEAAFAEANEAGGVHGRRLELVHLDDSYEPEAATTNTIRLIEMEKVFALIGAVGTPTSRSATPVAQEAGVPYIAPFTGAEFLRNAVELSTVLNMRASYYQETEEMVARLTTDLGIERIAVMYQDDSFGRAGYQGALNALERRGMRPVAIGTLPAQHHGGQSRPPRPREGRARSGHHHRRVRAGGRADRLGAAHGHRWTPYS